MYHVSFTSAEHKLVNAQAEEELTVRMPPIFGTDSEQRYRACMKQMHINALAPANVTNSGVPLKPVDSRAAAVSVCIPAVPTLSS